MAEQASLRGVPEMGSAGRALIGALRWFARFSVRRPLPDRLELNAVRMV